MRDHARSTVFAAALGVIALAVLDDAFVHLEAGTSAGDHVVSGLVPVAVAAALVAVQPRLPARAAGWLAVVAGALAAAAGIAGPVRHVADAGVAGDDVTGVLGGAAGLVLLGLGIVTLWRARRRDGPLWRLVARRAALALAVVVAGVFVVGPVAAAVVATHKPRADVPAADLGRPLTDVTLRTSDGLRLAAWYVPSSNRAAVIVFPGRTKTVPYARMLVRHGYGVLLLDRRGEGESDGDYNAFGWDGEPDLRAALAYLRRRPDVDPGRIGGLGLSVGGELLLQTAAHTTALRAVVAEGAGHRSIREQRHTPGVGRVQRWFTPDLALTAATAVASGDAPPPDLAALAGRIAPRPVLLIRAADGNEDEVLNDVYRRRSGAELWELPSGGHTGALKARPREYESRVVGFLDRALGR